MRKLSLLMLSAFVMFSCTNGNKGDKQNPSDMKYVSKITETDVYDTGRSREMLFDYDDQDRVTKISLEVDGVDPTAIQYETGKVKISTSGIWMQEDTMVDGVPIPGKEVYQTKTAIATLNADGYAQSGEMISTATGEKDKKMTWSNTYNEGYLQMVTTIEEGEDPYVDKCVWTAGNMISITDNTGEIRSTATYDTKNLNNPKCNLDLNWLVYHDEYFETLDNSLFNVLGYYGKRSANMVASTKNKYTEYTYEYTYDAAGFVTNVVIKDTKSNEIKETMVIEYK